MSGADDTLNIDPKKAPAYFIIGLLLCSVFYIWFSMLEMHDCAKKYGELFNLTEHYTNKTIGGSDLWRRTLYRQARFINNAGQ